MLPALSRRRVGTLSRPTTAGSEVAVIPHQSVCFRPRPARVSLAAAGVLLVLLLTACGSSQKVNPAASYTEQYRLGQYAEAYNSASNVYLSAGGPGGKSRDDAALIAGLSAQAMNRNDDADRWLNLVVRSSNREVSGRASAALGLIAQEKKQHDEAVRLLTNAGEKLGGDDAARAFMYAGDSARALRNPQDAQSLYKRAQDRADRDPELKSMISTRLIGGGPAPEQVGNTPGGTRGTIANPGPRTSSPSITGPGSPQPWNAATGAYTLQVGAFSTIQRANLHADTVKVRANTLGFGVPRVVTTSDRTGKPLYAVRIGRFPSLNDADRARRSFGTDARVIHAPGE
jgi:hypothetical protein